MGPEVSYIGEWYLVSVWCQSFKVITGSPFCLTVFCYCCHSHTLIYLPCLLLTICQLLSSNSICRETFSPGIIFTSINFEPQPYLSQVSLLLSNLGPCLQSLGVCTYSYMNLEHFVIRCSTFLWVWELSNFSTQIHVTSRKCPIGSHLQRHN